MKTIEVLRELDLKTPAEVYIVGGTVRDMLRKKKNNDLDIVFRGLGIKKVARFLNKYGHVKFVKIVKTNNIFDTFVLLFSAYDDKDNVVQISAAKRGRKQKTLPTNTLVQDSYCRDFTINAMYLPINKTTRNDIIDYHNGKKAIKNRIIVAISNAEDMLVASPIRILRAISLAALTKYKLDDALVKAIRKNLHLLHKIPFENVKTELNKVLLSKKPSIYFNLMRSLGILEIIMPELYRCIRVRQDARYHKYDVYKHCIYTCDNIKPELTLRLAAVLHDIGKVETRKMINGKITFHKHEMSSVKLAKRFLNRLRYSNDIAQEVLSLVRNHMYHYTRNFSDIAIHRFIIKTGITEKDIRNLTNFPLFQLRAAERLGNGLKTIPITTRQLDFEKRIVDVFNSSTAFKVSDLNINGDILMSVFRLEPGIMIGRILSYLFNRVIKEPNLNNKIDLVKMAAEFIVDKGIYNAVEED